MTTIPEQVGKRVRLARQARGWTQDQLGERLAPLLGNVWSRQSVSFAETGRRSFVAAELVAFAVALEVPVAALLPPGPDSPDALILLDVAEQLRELADRLTALASLVLIPERTTA